jgi:hypothetical protein
MVRTEPIFARQVPEKSEGWSVMFAIVVGFVLALIFFGLPLGIIGLFILSILDQKSRGVKKCSAVCVDFSKSWRQQVRDSLPPRDGTDMP